ncbi:KAP family P-loop NTPase fold protein [Campylobacter lari]
MALARTIKDSVSIGIIGDWGSGKTSFINMVLESLSINKKIVIINFNPWNISTRKQLISDFLTMLSKEICKVPFPEFKCRNLKKIYSHFKFKFFSEVSQNLEDLALLFKMSSYVIADPVISVAMSKTSNAISDFNKLLSAEKKGLDEIKNKINTALSNIDTKIIIVIDDLDRLADTDIREIFQLVRSIADFKNTMYILAYDNEIVTKALDKIQKDKGERYIEKIVQVPIVLPKLNKADLTAIFMQKIEQFSFVYEKIDKNEFIENLNTNHFAGAFENIRDINRYLNVLKFEMSAIKQELYLYDFAVITLFKLFEPKFYEFIYNYSEFFKRTALDSDEKNKELQKSTYTNFIDEQIKCLNKLNKEVVKNLLISVFPKIDDLYNRDFSNSKDRSDYKYKHRLAYSDYFQDYFVLNFAENVIRK